MAKFFGYETKRYKETFAYALENTKVYSVNDDDRKIESGGCEDIVENAEPKVFACTGCFSQDLSGKDIHEINNYISNIRPRI